MDLEHLIKLPYDSIHTQFYQYENDGMLHQIEYEYFRIEGTDLIINQQIPCLNKVINNTCEKSYRNWF